MLFIILGVVLSGNVLLADEQIYGSQLMTQQERQEYRTKMKSLKTKEERERFRIEHHEKMLERAKAQGVTLPDKPPAIGGGMGTGIGAGSGSGSGSGSGGGGGGGR
jgi:uncharacterized membrane protein YgcG